MKKIKYLGLLLLIIFTFVYTDKVMSTINENDSVMIEIKERMEQYKISPIDAIVEDDSIIPGINGREIDIMASYNSMKNNKVFNQNLLKYKTIYPNISLKNNMDKYIIQGNSNKSKVAIVYILNRDNILYGLDSKYVINVFINYSYLESNINDLVKFKSHEIYNYGNNGQYTNENIIMGNNIINNKTHNKSMYCLTLEKNINTLNTCSNNKMWTLIPNIKGGFLDVKKNISNGSIILLNNISDIESIYIYLNNKGYRIVGLSDLFSEDID